MPIRSSIRRAVTAGAAALGAAALAAFGAALPAAASPVAIPAPHASAGSAVAAAAPESTTFPTELLDALAPAATDSSAVQDFGACLNGGGEADLLLLVDESGSLLDSDPGAARVTSATYFVDQLAAYVADGGQPIDLQLGVFAHSASTLRPWTSLDDGSLPSIHDSINQLADRVEGFDTDYWTALDSAQRELGAKASASSGEAPRCQAIVMFTDGKLDIEPRLTSEQQQRYGTEKVFAPGVSLTTQAGAVEARDAAQHDICRDGGLADQLTSSGVKIFGIGLTPDPANAGDFDLFQAIVEGTGDGGTTCGSLTAQNRGDFFLAQDIDSLLFAFDSIVDDPTEIIGGICQQTPCSTEAHEFVLDTSTPDVRILAQADVPNLQVTIQMPNGTLVEFPRGEFGAATTLQVDGATFRYTWQTEKTVSIDATQSSAPTDVWMGLWQLAFTDPTGQSAGQQSRSNIHISGSLRPSVDGQESLEFHAGDTVELGLGIADRRSGEIDPSTIPGQMGYTASVVDAAGSTIDVLSTTDKNGLDDPASVDLASAAVGQAELRLTLDITTAPATRQDGSAVPGTQLAPAIVAVPVTILTPANFPALGASIDFGRATGDVDLTATLPVAGEGCVWVADGDPPNVVAAPDGIGDVGITAGGNSSAESCFAAGSGDGIELTLRTDAPGNGTINGTVPVMLGAADGNAEPIRVDVPFTANLEKPLNTLNFLLVLIAALILGIGVPLLLLYLAKWAISKVPSRPLVATAIPVTVAHGQVLRGTSRFEIGPGDLVNTIPIPPGGGRTLRVGDITLRAKTGATPTGAGFVTVDAPGRVSAGSTMPSTDSTGLRGRLPLAVHNTWVVLHADGAPADQAQVLVLVGGDATPASRADLQNDINRRLPGLLEKLVREQGGVPAGGEGQFAAVGSPFQNAAGGQQQQGSPFQGAAGGQQQGSPFQGGSSPFQGGGQTSSGSDSPFRGGSPFDEQQGHDGQPGPGGQQGPGGKPGAGGQDPWGAR